MKSKPIYSTKLGRIYLADSLELMRDHFDDQSVDLIMTSPPFGLVRKKSYGNVDSDKYVQWFKSFGEQFKRILKPNGSLVIDIGGAWISGQPTRSLYHYELLISLCKEIGFHLAQDLYWWSPSKLPTPAEWVTVRRIRIKDAINCIWWLSPTPWPKASNRRVLSPYSDSMKLLLKNGYKAKLRPSGHDISDKFSIDNGAAIPPNLLALPNTESNSYYLRYCKEQGLAPHPARFPIDLPLFFIRMLTDIGDIVFDPFAGSCVTGEAAERLERRWVCSDNVEEYLQGALGRFESRGTLFPLPQQTKEIFYRLAHPSASINIAENEVLAIDGGKSRITKKKIYIDNNLSQVGMVHDANLQRKIKAKQSTVKYKRIKAKRTVKGKS
jgi:site-specific DNA-methyltransferase (cytosine-N4-specific)